MHVWVENKYHLSVWRRQATIYKILTFVQQNSKRGHWSQTQRRGYREKESYALLEIETDLKGVT